MSRSAERQRAFLDKSALNALVRICEAKGSTPREGGAEMLVSLAAIFGTIGGGQLELRAIERARAMLEEGADKAVLDIPLGPEIGQCCGGRVRLFIRRVDQVLRTELLQNARAEDATMPHAYVFGNGHVGSVLASILALMPIHTVVVETRPEMVESMPSGAETRLTLLPEEVVLEAHPGSAFVVLTHDHALDFLIAGEALRRRDACYVGMIGSKTKKSAFKNWFLSEGGGTEKAFARLVLPIGISAVKDKRPAIIAALAAAEIITALDERHATTKLHAIEADDHLAVPFG